MKDRSVYTLLLLVVALFVSCTTDDPDGPDGKNKLSVTSVLAVPDVENNGHIAASMNGKYIYTFHGKDEVFYSTDSGESWSGFYFTEGVRSYFYDNLKISNNGYTIIEGGGFTSYWIDLKTKKYNKIEPPVQHNNTAKVYVGADDYFYFVYNGVVYYKKPADTTWEQLPEAIATLGRYIGQEITGGGIAFYNGQAGEVKIHYPADNSIQSKSINIDLSLIPAKSPKPASAIVPAFDGENVLAIGNDNGVAMGNLKTGHVSYVAWDSFNMTTSQLTDLAVTNDNVVYVKWNWMYNKNLTNYFKLENSQLTKMDGGRGKVIALNNWVYFYGRFKVHRLIDGVEDRFYSVTRENKREKSRLSAVAMVSNEFYVVISKKVYKYDKAKDDFLLVNSLSDYDFESLYADGNKVIAYGVEFTASSNNAGANWELIPVDEAVRYIHHVEKSGSKYYGMSLTNDGRPLGGTGFSSSAFSLTVYTSSDAIRWEKYSPTLVTNGYAPDAMTADGIITYSVNVNPMGNMVIERYYTKDYGKNWHRNDDVISFNGSYKNELYMVNNGMLTVFDKNFKTKSNRQLVFDDGFDFKGSGAQNVFADSKGNIYFSYLGKLYRIEKK